MHPARYAHRPALGLLAATAAAMRAQAVALQYLTAEVQATDDATFWKEFGQRHAGDMESSDACMDLLQSLETLIAAVADLSGATSGRVLALAEKGG